MAQCTPNPPLNDVPERSATRHHASLINLVCRGWEYRPQPARPRWCLAV